LTSSAAEGPIEVALICEATDQCDLRKRVAGISQQIFGSFNTQGSQPAIGGNTNAMAECARKVCSGQTTLMCNARNAHRAIDVGIQQLFSPSELPGRESTVESVGTELQSTVLVQYMILQAKNDMIN